MGIFCLNLGREHVPNLKGLLGSGIGALEQHELAVSVGHMEEEPPLLLDGLHSLSCGCELNPRRLCRGFPRPMLSDLDQLN